VRQREDIKNLIDFGFKPLQGLKGGANKRTPLTIVHRGDITLAYDGEGCPWWANGTHKIAGFEIEE